MNQQINFSDNANGKLFPDRFGDIRMLDDKFSAGNHLDVYLRGKELGTVKVLGAKVFSWKRLTDILSYINCGHGAAYQSRLLHNFYGKQYKISPDTQFMYVVFEWVHRNIPAQDALMEDWWKSKREQYHPFINQPTLFS